MVLLKEELAEVRKVRHDLKHSFLDPGGINAFEGGGVILSALHTYAVACVWSVINAGPKPYSDGGGDEWLNQRRTAPAALVTFIII